MFLIMLLINWLLHSWSFTSIIIKILVLCFLILILGCSITKNQPDEFIRWYVLPTIAFPFKYIHNRLHNYEFETWRKPKCIPMKKFVAENEKTQLEVTNAMKNKYEVLDNVFFTGTNTTGEDEPAVFRVDNLIIGEFGVCMVETFDFENTAVVDFNDRSLKFLYHPTNVYGSIRTYDKCSQTIYRNKKRNVNYGEGFLMIAPSQRLKLYKNKLESTLYYYDKKWYDLLKGHVYTKCYAPNVLKNCYKDCFDSNHKNVVIDKFPVEGVYVESLKELKSELNSLPKFFTKKQVKELKKLFEEIQEVKFGNTRKRKREALNAYYAMVNTKQYRNQTNCEWVKDYNHFDSRAPW